MMREKIKIRKIDCLPARQVPFSKRSRGIFKKAGELSILCESEVAVIIFSQTGKLFDFSSSSTKDVIARYKNKSHTSGKNQINPRLINCRQMKGEERQDVGLDELQKLEK